MSARAYARQARLVEVGVDGQARIEAASVVVEGDAAARAIAEDYLARAGTGSAAANAPAITVACASVALVAGPAAVAGGALAALVALRAALGLGAASDVLRSTETDAAREL